MHQLTTSALSSVSIFTQVVKYLLLKKDIIAFGGSALSGCEFVNERRSSSQHSASEAEADDIIHILEVLDNDNALQNVKFAALQLDRVPKYDPEEINVCAVVDRQVHTDTVLGDLVVKVDTLRND